MNFLQSFFKKSIEDKIYDIAAQLAYYFLLAMLPLLMLLISIIGFFSIDTDGILSLINAYVPGGAFAIIQNNLNAILNSQSVGLLSLSTTATLWLSLMGTFAIIRAINAAYRLKIPSLLSMLGKGIILVLSLLLAIIISLLLPIYGEPLGAFVFRFIGLDDYFLQLWSWIRWIISFLVIGAILGIIYKVVPNRKTTWRESLPGATLALLTWQAASFGFSFYVSVSDYSMIYGNLGNLIVLMLWFYLTGFAILLGGEWNACLYERDNKAIEI
ncbi:YihY/virulence factor BrkB family protein [Marinococcus halophilus]|uniref:YihY/virulence factor BrkB family protein n=1 Tax=Marinococcus halophilus TaxID=1371 RepID=UPI0015C46E54|nr:YihY/virulence factor BrkB family protein [Marinococcus halophilus]